MFSDFKHLWAIFPLGFIWRGKFQFPCCFIGLSVKSSEAGYLCYFFHLQTCWYLSYISPSNQLHIRKYYALSVNWISKIGLPNQCYNADLGQGKKCASFIWTFYEKAVSALFVRWLKEKEQSDFVLHFAVDYICNSGKGTCFNIYLNMTVKHYRMNPKIIETTWSVCDSFFPNCN